MIHEVRAQVNFCTARIDLLFFDRSRLGPDSRPRISIAKPLTFELVRADEPLAIDPTCTMPRDAAQTLIDELWRCGLRPSEGSGSAGAMAATQKHLEDMRKLVFKA
jgi:hypothetical protein